MNDNHIEIKERRASLVAKGIIFLLLAVFSLSVALLPYLISEFKDNSLTFFLCGGIAFCFYATMFVFLLYKECNPDNALTLNSRGFIDTKNIGPNVVIEWTNVASVKIMGKKEMPHLGITLENADLVMAHMKKPYVEEMRENIEEGLPHILLSQKEIRYPLSDLKELFVKFAREARALKNDIPVKPKSNPFTKEDVLRAFGQLDPIQKDIQTEDPVDNEENDPSEAVVESYTTAYEEEKRVSEEPANDEPENNQEIKSIDSFYEMLMRQTDSSNQHKNDEANDINEAEEPLETSVNIEENKENETETALNEEVVEKEDDLSVEIFELMSKAKSSKISEIEKILNEKDVPFSSVKSASDSEIFTVDPIKSNEEFSIKGFKDNASDEPKSETLSITDNTVNMGDTREFVPEIIHFDDIE